MQMSNCTVHKLINCNINILKQIVAQSLVKIVISENCITSIKVEQILQ